MDARTKSKRSEDLVVALHLPDRPDAPRECIRIGRSLSAFRA
jgi:hypothetical protein